MKLANTVTEKREIALEVLSNKNSIKGMFSDLHMDEAESIYAKITEVMDDKRAAYQTEAAEREEKLNVLKAISDQLIAQGLTEDDVSSFMKGNSFGKSKKKRIVKEQPTFKFNYKVDGVDKVYVGKIAGRKPNDFANYLKANTMSLADVVDPADREAFQLAKQK